MLCGVDSLRARRTARSRSHASDSYDNVVAINETGNDNDTSTIDTTTCYLDYCTLWVARVFVVNRDASSAPQDS